MFLGKKRNQPVVLLYVDSIHGSHQRWRLPVHERILAWFELDNMRECQDGEKEKNNLFLHRTATSILSKVPWPFLKSK